jgi:predicted DNA-binding transcriptional regulator YafY
MTLAALADRYACCERTIRRAIYALRRAGVDIEQAPARESEATNIYHLDRRAWNGLLFLPVDGGVR